MSERWLPVPGYEGLYEVSDQGRVRSIDCLDRLGRRRKGRVRVLTRDGYYLKVSLSRDGKLKSFWVHALVLTAFVGPRPEGMECCHGPGGPLDNRLENLRWDTPSANSYDTVSHGNHHYARRDRCSRGHPLVPRNLLNERNKGRECRACHSGRAAYQKGRYVSIQAGADAWLARHCPDLV